MPHTPESRPEPDVILYVPTAELTETADLVPNRYDPTAEGRGRRRHTLEHPALDLYNGYDGLLVRTALIRSADYDAKDLPHIEGAEDVANLCRHLIHSPHEHFIALSINGAGDVVAIHEAAIGPAHHTSFTVQQVFQVAFLTGADAMVVVHNHPSGVPQPSEADCHATAAIARGAACISIRLLDSLIVGQRGFFSFQEFTALEQAEELIPRIGRFRWQLWKSS